MDLLEILCRELGVEIGEEWLGNDGQRYKFKQDGTLYMTSMCAELDESGYKAVLVGELKPMWKPAIGGEYFVPRLAWEEDTRYSFIRWEADKTDSWYWEHNLVCKTKEDAIELATKMLKSIK